MFPPIFGISFRNFDNGLTSPTVNRLGFPTKIQERKSGLQGCIIRESKFSQMDVLHSR